MRPMSKYSFERQRVVRPQKKLGQNFLRAPFYVQQIIQRCGLDKKTAVLEIGPGEGALTGSLIQEAGAYWGLEIDPQLVQYLNNELLGSCGNAVVVMQDALKAPWSDLIQEALAYPGIEKIKIVGNLPYNIATVLLFKLLPALNPVTSCVFMLQKEVVDRIVAQPCTEHYGRLSILLQYCCHIESCFDVPPEAFYPPPKVMSSVLEMRPYAHLQHPHCPPIALHDLEKLAQIAFKNPRKTLLNNLKTYLDKSGFEHLQIDPQSRAEQLSIADFASIGIFLSDVNKKL